jgi:hypothetical protein
MKENDGINDNKEISFSISKKIAVHLSVTCIYLYIHMKNQCLIPPFAKELVPYWLSIRPERRTDCDGRKPDNIVSITEDSLLCQSQHQIFF